MRLEETSDWHRVRTTLPVPADLSRFKICTRRPSQIHHIHDRRRHPEPHALASRSRVVLAYPARCSDHTHVRLLSNSGELFGQRHQSPAVSASQQMPQVHLIYPVSFWLSNDTMPSQPQPEVVDVSWRRPTKHPPCNSRAVHRARDRTTHANSSHLITSRPFLEPSICISSLLRLPPHFPIHHSRDVGTRARFAAHGPSR
jgi:hypothetical protein